jgi:hypothetical protein
MSRSALRLFYSSNNLTGRNTMSSVDVRLKFSEEQLAALDGYLEPLARQFGVRVSRSQAIRDFVGKQIEQAGFEWPADPALGGPRRSVPPVE